MRRIADWARRLVQGEIDRAAARMHSRLLRDPDPHDWVPQTVAAVALSALILVGAAGAVVAMVWATMHAQGFVSWILVVTGWVVLLAMFPRPGKLPEETVVLDPAAYPAIHGLVTALAAGVGAPRPRVIGVDPQLNAWVCGVGWRHRPALVIGLPLWVCCDREQRLGLLGHELGHLAAGDTVVGRLLDGARSALGAFVAVLWQPGPRDGLRQWLVASHSWVGPWWSTGAEEGVARFILRVLAVPFLLVLTLLAWLAASHRQYREYRADRRSALATGSAGLATGLRLDARGLHTVASSAVRRGEDPFVAIAERAGAAADPRRTSRWDDSHPPTELRIDLLERHPVPVGQVVLDPALLTAAEAELDGLRAPLARQVRDFLLDTYAQ